MRYQLTEEAARDVEEILAYSTNSFGLAQTEHGIKWTSIIRVHKNKDLDLE